MIEKIHNKIFGKIHKNNLIYNACWEDPRIDREAMEINSSSRIVVLTSAGCNSLDYLLAGAKELHAVDMNFKQNALLEFKVAAARSLEYEDYFQLLGCGYHVNAERIYQTGISQYLNDDTAKFWDSSISLFSGKSSSESFYFRGTSGFVAWCMNKYINLFPGVRRALLMMLEMQDSPRQRSLYEQYVKPKIWNSTLKFTAKRHLTMALLGVPQSQRRWLDKDYEGGVAEFIESALDAVFGDLSLADNYFWRVYLTGSYTPSCCPEYLTYGGYCQIRDELWAKVKTHTGSLVEVLATLPKPITHYVLLDHMDWLTDNLNHILQQEWQQILGTCSEDARVLWRSAAKKTNFVDAIPIRIGNKLCPLSDFISYDLEKADKLHSKDRVHTYSSFSIAHLNTANL